MELQNPNVALRIKVPGERESRLAKGHKLGQGPSDTEPSLATRWSKEISPKCKGLKRSAPKRSQLINTQTQVLPHNITSKAKAAVSSCLLKAAGVKCWLP